MTKKTTKGNERIKAAMKEREAGILRLIDRYGSFQINRFGVASVATYNAKDRLVAAGKIKYDRKADNGCGGYVRS